MPWLLWHQWFVGDWPRYLTATGWKMASNIFQPLENHHLLDMAIFTAALAKVLLKTSNEEPLPSLTAEALGNEVQEQVSALLKTQNKRIFGKTLVME